MPDIFISYKSEERALPQALAEFLRAQGYTVWWDMELVGGPSFRRQILDKLAEARAVIVIWTPASVESDFVLDEADRAKRMKKLIPVRTPDVKGDELPPGHGQAQTYLVSDYEHILRALVAMGLRPPVRVAENIIVDTISDPSPETVITAAPSALLKEAKAQAGFGWVKWAVGAAFIITVMVFAALYFGISPQQIAPIADMAKPSDCAKTGSYAEPAPKTGTGNPLAVGGYEDKGKGLIRTLRGHRGEVFRTALFTDSRIIVSRSNDPTLKLWDAATGELICTFEGHRAPVDSVAVAADGKTIVSGESGQNR
jgi:hypothetical protein